MNGERRRYPRVKVPLEVEFQRDGESLCHHATLVDLSAGGAAMMTEDPLPTGGHLAALRFKLESNNGGRSAVIETETEIMRCDERPGVGRASEYLVGVRFLNLPKDDFETLRHFVEDRIADDEPVAPRIELEQPIAIRYQRFDEFVGEVATNLSASGMFIRAKKPPPPGTVLDFSFQLGDDFELIQGKGEVVWTRPLAEDDERPAGMGIRFLELDEVSERVLQQIIEKRLGQEQEEAEARDALELRDQLEDAFSQLQQGQAQLDATREELENQARTSAKTIAGLETDLATATQRIADLDRKLVVAHKRAADLDGQIASTADERAEIERRLRRAEQETEAARARQHELESTLAATEEERDSLHQRGSEAGGELDRIRKERDAACAAAEKLEARFGEIESERDATRQSVEGLEARLSEAASSRDTAQRKVEELEARIAEAEGERSQEQGAIAEERKAKERARDEFQALQERYKSLAAENRSYRNELEKALAAQQEISRQKEDLLAGMDELRDEADDRVRHLDEELASLREEAGTLRERLEIDHADKKRIREDLERSEHERKRVVGKFERLNFEMEELLLATEDWREKEQALRGLEEEGNELRERNERLTAEVEDLRKAAAEHEEALRAEIADLEDRESGVQEEVQRLQEAESAQRREVEELQETVAEMRDRLEMASAEVEGVAQSKIEELETEIERQAEEISGASRIESELRDEIAALQDSLDNAVRERAELSNDLDRAREPRDDRGDLQREYEEAQAGLIANQERLEEELREAREQIARTPARPGRSTSKRPAVRGGFLRAAGLMALGLLLGFFGSYPFEELLASAESGASPSGAPPVRARAEVESVADIEELSPEAGAVEVAGTVDGNEIAATDPGSETISAPSTRPSPEETIERWARSWSGQRVDEYLAHYSSSFATPEEIDRPTWESQRRERILGPSSIQVIVDGLEVSSYTPERATVSFDQSYAADFYSDRVRKTIDLVWEADDWRIAREVSEPIEAPATQDPAP